MNTRIRSVVISERGQIVIPEDMRRDLNLNGRQTLVLMEANQEIILKKESEVVSAILGKSTKTSDVISCALLSERALAKDWLSKKEDQAWKHL